ncbi:MAG: Stp1/IreP family PP2C-type Ser/Thr phosphatase [Anaerolineae bacterium]
MKTGSKRGWRAVLFVAVVLTLSACHLPLPDGVSPKLPGRLLAASLGGVLVAGALLIAILLLFTRFKTPEAHRGEKSRVTSGPMMATAAALEALPERTLVGDGRYLVLNVHTAAETPDALQNSYTVRGTTSLTRCPYCDAPIGGEEPRTCTRCGADLRGITLIYPKFLMRETVDAQTFQASAELAALRLRHPALILPEDVFTNTTFEPPRHYRIEPVFKRAHDVSSPQAVEKVLQWGVALAQGMAYLHHHYVVLQNIDLEHVVLGDSIAQHVCIDNVVLLPREVHAQADIYFAENVRALASLLLALLGTSFDNTSSEEIALAEPVVTLLVRAQERGKTADVFAAGLESALRGLHAPENVRVRVGMLTDVGRMRTVNEDSVLALDLTERFAALGLPVGVYAVADGMGGHAAGDVASQLTIQAIQETVDSLRLEAEGKLPDARIWLEQLVTAANQAVYNHRRTADSDMGCTLVLALAIGGHITIANIGDSRAYWLSADGATQVTTDHSLVERLVAAGHITAQEAREHPRRNIIYRVVGDKPKADFDLFEQVLAPGEALLLCSDGLSGMLPDARIWTLWHGAPSPQAACEQLVAAANQAGGNDNVSVIVVQVDALEASQP